VSRSSFLKEEIVKPSPEVLGKTLKDTTWTRLKAEGPGWRELGVLGAGWREVNRGVGMGSVSPPISNIHWEGGT
jgi:hypothetical protein